MDLLRNFHTLLSQFICLGNKYPQEMSENLSKYVAELEFTVFSVGTP